jgi:MFS family permease
VVRSGRRLGRDPRLLIAGQGLRAAGYGFTAVLLGALLAARGYTALQVGLVLTALIAGTALASLAVGAFADRIGRRRCYGLFFAGIAVAGLVVAAGTPLWAVVLAAVTGTLSTDVVDNGPATTLEQAMLAAEDAGTARVFGRYNMVGAAGALGALAVTLPGLGRGSAGPDSWLFAVLVRSGRPASWSPCGCRPRWRHSRRSPAAGSRPRGCVRGSGSPGRWCGGWQRCSRSTPAAAGWSRVSIGDRSKECAQCRSTIEDTIWTP